MKIELISFIAAFFLYSSCDYKLLVKKSDVIYNECGYLVILSGASFFIEYPDSTYNLDKIMNKIDENTFYLNELSAQEEYAIKEVSKVGFVNTLDQFDKSTIYTDTILYLYVRIKGKPNDQSYTKTNKYHEIVYKGKSYAIYYHYFNYDLYYLFPVTRNDRILYNSKLYEFYKK